MSSSVTSVVIGDPHIRTKEIEFSQLMIDEIVEKTKKLNPDLIVVLGDILDTHNNVDSGPLSRAVEFLKKLQEISFLVVLIGNHDLRNNRVFIQEDDFVEHPFTALHKWKNTIVCDVAKTFEVKGFKFCGVPYVPVGKYHEAIKDINTEEIAAFFSHQEFYKVQYTLSDKPSTEGDKWSKKYPLNICGHIHEAQILADNLIYVGTPVQQDFGASIDKGIAVFIFDEHKLEPEVNIKNCGLISYIYTRIPLETVPLREHYQITADQTDRLEKIYRRTKRKLKSRIILLKITITGTSSELKSIMGSKTIKDFRNLEGLKDLIILPNPTSVSSEIINQIKIPKSARTFKNLVETFLEEDPELKTLYQEIFFKGKTKPEIKIKVK